MYAKGTDTLTSLTQTRSYSSTPHVFSQLAAPSRQGSRNAAVYHVITPATIRRDAHGLSR